MNCRFFTRVQTAELIRVRFGLPCSRKTLEKWAVVGGGPRFVRSGARVLYPEDEIVAWFESRTSGRMASTSAIARPSKSKPFDISEPSYKNKLNEIN